MPSNQVRPNGMKFNQFIQLRGINWPAYQFRRGLIEHVETALTTSPLTLLTCSANSLIRSACLRSVHGLDAVRALAACPHLGQLTALELFDPR